MPCPDPDLVLAYFARTLDARERDEVEAHVDLCSACRMLLAELVRTDHDLVTFTTERDPEHIGRYRIESRLGDGGMGTVYAAYDAQLERRVAIKLVHPELAARGVDRLLREGRTLARLSHRNVVAVHDAGTDGDRVYIVMELVAGETLAAWLRARARPAAEILAMFVAAARGLAASHAVGIIHRDVKPENVMIDRDGCVKVTDFGLALAVSEAVPPGTILGTPAFMSPEQRRGGDVGPATDQYSLCAALRGALLDGANPAAVPRRIRRALARGLAESPTDRFRSMDELAAALDHRPRRGPVLAGVGLVVLALALALVLRRSEDPARRACIEMRSATTGRWTSAEREAVRRAIANTGVGYADETWSRVDAAATMYEHALQRAEAQTCSQLPATAEARAVFARSVTCFATRRSDLAGFATRARSITAADVRFSVASIHDLAPVEDCTNAALLVDDQNSMTHAAVRDVMRMSRTLRRQGAYRAAADRARIAVDLARPVGGRLLAKALVNHGDIAMAVDGAVVAEASYREAATTAERAHADDVRALAMASLMAALAREGGREQEALALEPLVTAAIERSGRDAALRPIVLQAAGTALMRLGQIPASVQSFEAALALARQAIPRGDPRMPDYLYLPGVALGQIRRDADALRYFEEAYRVAAETWGEHHPETARFMINLATKHAALGDCATALRELAGARKILTGVLPLDAPEHLQLTQAMGACYYIQHDTANALREYTARQQALTAAGRTRSVEMAASWVDVGDVQYEQKDHAAAATSYRASVALYEDLLGIHDARLGMPLSRLGETELAASHAAAAVPPLERALAIYTASKVPVLVAADVMFPLARALVGTQRSRAISLASAARDAYAAGGPAFAERAQAATAWLAHPR